MSEHRGAKRKCSSHKKHSKLEATTCDKTDFNSGKPCRPFDKGSSSKTELLNSSNFSSLNSSSCETSNSLFNYMKNDILEEVLNAKKAALLQSPAIVKLLQAEQLKKQKQ